MTMKRPELSRRSFVKAGGALAVLAAAGDAVSTAEDLFDNVEPAHAAADDQIVWSQYNVNCGGRCVFQWHVRDGKIAYMLTDDTGSDDFQARACLRGRAMRQWINHPDRLQYPMKRTGPRGTGKFERISWDEAIDTIADKLKYTIETYGNDSIYINYATGMYSATGRTTERIIDDDGDGRPIRPESHLGTMRVTVERNAYGRQLASFHATGDFMGIGAVTMSFIRAPRIIEVREGAVELARVDGGIVAARDGSQVGVAFHPELDDDPRIHELFLSL